MKSLGYSGQIALSVLLVVVISFFGCSSNESSGQNAEIAKTSLSDSLITSKAEASSDVSRSDANGKIPKIKFVETTHDFGKQISGPDLTYSYIFTNVGDGTLIIENVKAG